MTNYDGKAENDQLHPLKIQEGMKIQWPFQFKRKLQIWFMIILSHSWSFLGMVCTVYTVHVLYVQYMYCMYSTCTVCTIYVLYVQYMYYMYSTCFVDEMYFQRRFLRKNDFEKMTLFFENIRFKKKYTLFVQKHYF